MQYTRGSHSRTACPNIIRKVLEYHAKLLKWQNAMKQGTMPALPLLATHLEYRLAILICKVWVPPLIKDMSIKATPFPHHSNYFTPVIASVCPHFLVHIQRG